MTVGDSTGLGLVVPHDMVLDRLGRMSVTDQRLLGAAVGARR